MNRLRVGHCDFFHKQGGRKICPPYFNIRLKYRNGNSHAMDLGQLFGGAGSRWGHDQPRGNKKTTLGQRADRGWLELRCLMICVGVYRNLPTFSIRSTVRQLYPHSLSYQLTTLSMLPSMTWVQSVTKMELCESPMMSVETSGSSVQSR